ncbi:MAG: TonB-dependent receptor [Saprospiraceae bacterium]|nr:TonB-dependent receptor [Saprospiraceae bacterium]
MKKTFFTFLMLYLGLLCANAQRFSIKGMVADSASAPLEWATVALLAAQDSSLVNFATSDAKGGFEIKGVGGGSYVVQISFVGYTTYSRAIELKENLDMGSIVMEPQSNNLNEVLVTSDRIPVMVKKDTIEFNANSFKTQPNAVVEDLLKKLPGVTVEPDGTVKAQGQTVQNVLVEGKEFFGSDPKIATKNLPADAVDKVQVFDKKSDQATFSGIDDGQREKTINLDLKEDRKNGFFGYAMAGGGTDERYEGRLSLNKFDAKQQFGLLASANNINQQSFSIQDYLSFSGEMQRMMSGGGGSFRLDFNSDSEDGGMIPFGFNNNNGLTTTWSGGLNLNRTLGKKKNTELSANYFYNQLDNETQRVTTTQTFLPEGAFTNQSNSLNHSQNDNHRLNLNIDSKLDSFNSVKLMTSLSYTETKTEVESASEALNGAKSLNDGTRNSFSEGNSVNLNSSLLYRHKFAKKGRTLSTTFSFGLNNGDREGELEAVNQYYDPLLGNLTRVDSILQNQQQQSDRMNYGVVASYTEPLGNRKYLEFNYAYRLNHSENNREVYDFERENPNAPIFNPMLSNRFSSDFDYHRGGLNFRWNTKKSNLTAGIQAQQAQLSGELPLLNTEVNRSFFNWLPSVRWQYEFSRTRNLNFNYETSVREPSVTQLQPVADISDPLNIYQGNPNLDPEYAHRFNLHWVSFNPGTMTNFFSMMAFTYTQDKIQTAQTIDANFVRTNQPVNVDNEYDLYASVSYGMPIKAISTRMDASLNANYNRGIFPVNGENNETERFSPSGEFSLTYNYKELLELTASANASFNSTQYSLDPSLNQEFVNQIYTAGFNLSLPLDIRIGSSFDYSIYGGIEERIPLWSASVSKYLLKNKRGELKLSVFDILNRNVGINRVAQNNYLLEERITSLGRYAMLSFTYNLQGFGGNAGGPQIRMVQRRF